ncbi:hypothetical protein [Adhaeretor mobilis]|uniref:Uncharacterized protein n=1 Tax=Adhaeretor mobilis TaxID=1930276 RepID=A0A517MZT3_9BACT|nr:hypothetical protein [Adhaeretor mobilis]QDT00308.1 hypothetical protein HG15A2_36440 [Adhaeretor mobilis]
MKIPLPILALLLLASVTSCLGCGGDTGSADPQTADQTKGEEEAAEKKKKDDYEALPLVPTLSQQIIQADDGGALPLVKPGHWTAVSQLFRANYDDLNGFVTFAPIERKKQQPLPIRYTPYAMQSGRPALLAKNQPKRIEGEIFVPEDSPTLSAVSRLQRSEYGGELIERAYPWTKMPSHQYFFLVLSKEPQKYAFLKTTDTVLAPWQDYNFGENHALHYRVALVDGTKHVSFPANVLTCTSLAYVLWDDVNLDRMQPDQQRALVDWIHWGGRLIVNGPNSLDTLRGSFLDKYLPAEAGASTTLRASDLQTLSSYWGQRTKGKSAPPITPTSPFSAISLKLRPSARYMPNTGRLFAEKTVGLGSVVCSSLQLDERDFINWPGYDGFLNGALLARPARVFDLEPSVGSDLRSTWANYGERRLDAYFTTGMRWFARDMGTQAGVTMEDQPDQSGGWSNYPPGSPERMKSVAERPGGLGSWNDFSPVSSAARESLRVAAGVRVPGSGFVVACLAVYLFVLVPLNWMVFHALGRVEWAWIAAPVIAVAGALVIVQQANLDIGFVRAQTEIGFLELHNDYPRAHLSRYSALYASLSTTYDVEFDDLSAVSKPFPDNDSYELPYGNSRELLSFEKLDKTRLKGLAITSSSTKFVHSEEMLTLGEGIKFSTSSSGASKQIINRLGVDLNDAAVVWRHKDRTTGKFRFDACWLGQLRNGENRAIPWASLPGGTVASGGKSLPFAEERKSVAEFKQERLDIDDLLKLAFQFPVADDPRYTDREQYRLVARLDETLPGARVEPKPSQSVGATVVLAHLQLAPPAVSKPDVNSPSDVAPDRRSNNVLSPLE